MQNNGYTNEPIAIETPAYTFKKRLDDIRMYVNRYGVIDQHAFNKLIFALEDYAEDVQNPKGATIAAKMIDVPPFVDPYGIEWKPTHRHFKGGLYRVINEFVLDTETDKLMVVYENSEHQFFTRTRSNFYESVKNADNHWTLRFCRLI